MRMRQIQLNVDLVKCAQFIIALLIFDSCLEPINVTAKRKGDALIVSGRVSTIADRNYIRLGRTAEEKRIPFPESGASLFLLDEDNNTFAFTESPDVAGTYLLENFVGEPGKEYRLQIILADGVSSYQSAPERMPLASGAFLPLTSIQDMEFTDNEGTVLTKPFFQIRVDVTLATTEMSFIKWQTEEAYLLTPTDFPDPFGTVPPSCYVLRDVDPQRLTLYNSRDFTSSRLEDILLASRLIDYSFNEKHYFTIYQSFITPEAYEYWQNVKELVTQVGTIFDTPPALIRGNVVSNQDPDELVFGYFQAANESYERIVTYKEEISVPIEGPCTYHPERTYYPSRCLRCENEVGSTFTRPSWF
jgi:hypothetical protein